jgi:hypothetical protein
MKRMLFAIAAFALILPAASCAVAGGFSNEKIRYKMAVTVETPEGLKTGTAVREAGRYTEPSILPDQGGTSYNVTKGEAVVVDLGKRGVLFVLLEGEWEAKAVFRELSKLSGKEAIELSQSSEKGRPFRSAYFKNLSDPTSVRIVNTLKLENEFGDGVNVSSFILKFTDDPVTQGVVDKYLPWLDSMRGGYLHGGKTARGAPYGLHGGNFKTGER